MSDIKIPDTCYDHCIAAPVCDCQNNRFGDRCIRFHKALSDRYQERPTITKKDGNARMVGVSRGNISNMDEAIWRHKK